MLWHLLTLYDTLNYSILINGIVLKPVVAKQILLCILLVNYLILND